MAQNNPYSWLSYLQARQALSLRLNDTAQIFWTDAEVGLYIKEALREWNCLTSTWVQDWVTLSSSVIWQSTGNGVNPFVGNNPTSPRYQTLTDSYVYTLAQYHLLEPPTGNGTWTGTTQFNLSDFTQSLQRRRDFILQATACNIGPFSSTFGIPAGTSRVQVPDSASQSILDLRRVRFVPAAGQGDPITLWREDGLAFEYFDTPAQLNSPSAWDVIAGPPQFITLDTPAPVPNTLDILAMISGGMISPPTPSPLLIPDDYYWVLKWGMLADLLIKESESTDIERALYCEQRFREGLQLMQEMPWLTQARINDIPVDTPSVAEMDTFAYEWESDGNAQPAIVRGGIDLFAICPTYAGTGFGSGGFGGGGFGGGSGTPSSITLSLVGNAPMPVADGDFIQLSRDVLDVVLDEAQHLANFKCGGQEWYRAGELHRNFIKAATDTNKRLRGSGIFETTLFPPNSRQNAAQPRFAQESK